MTRDCPLVLMLGASMNYPGGMTEVIRSYSAAGMFEAWPVRYISTYAGRSFAAKLRPWLAAIGAVFLRLAGRRVALVHVHSAAYGSFWRKSALCALALAFGVPYVIHLHDGRLAEFRRGSSALTRAWLRFTLRKAARVVVLTRHWRDVVRAIEPAARISIIGNPVPVAARPQPLRRPARTVLFIAWLQQEKGVLDLLAAMPRVLRAVPEASFVVAGRGIAGGETPESLRALAARLGVEGALRLPGWVTGPAKSVLLREADLFVLPSYVEALPVGVLEAMACGVPVVATRVGGVPDVIEDGVHGLLVEPGDPEGLARAMIALLSDDALRERVQQAAHRQVQARYSTRAVLAELEALYRDLGVVLP
jgi:glycosyltransferase involved in cell wall biosynthesis